MKFIYTLVFSCCCSFVASQGSQSIDVSGSIAYTDQIVTFDSQSSSIYDFYEAVFNWQFGFNYNRSLTRRIWLRGGLKLAAFGHQIPDTPLFYSCQFDGLGGVGPDGCSNLSPDLPTEIGFRTDLYFLQIPIALRYQITDSKFSLFVETGVAPSLYLTTRNRTTTNLSRDVNVAREISDSFRNFYWTATLAVGTNYNINERWQIFGQPTFNYFLQPYGKSQNFFSVRAYSVGLEFGLRRQW